MPGLSLNLSQAIRLFGIAPSTCRAVLDDLDRYAARCENFVPVVTRRAVRGARSAPEDTGNQPSALPGYQGQRTWLVRTGDLRRVRDRHYRRE